MKLSNQGLPKWPQMLVSGVDVTPEQAEEIIFRTDPRIIDTWFSNYDPPQVIDYHQKSGLAEAREALKGQPFHPAWMFRAGLVSDLGFVDCTFVHNNWVSSSYIYGPHGWCSPQGKISFRDNVGKWPTTTAVRADWAKIAAAFPFLDLNVTLMSGEHCEDNTVPVVNMRVKGGKVRLQKPNLKVHPVGLVSGDDRVITLGPMQCAMSEEFMARSAARVKAVVSVLLPKIPKYVPEDEESPFSVTVQ